jgi:PAS domain-containing protein
VKKTRGPAEWPILQVTIKGQKTDHPPVWVLTSYDSRAGSRGAEANATGLAATLAAAQALAQAQDWRTRYRQVLDSNRTVVASFDARTGAAEWGEGASELLRTNAGALLTVQDFIAHADPQEQPALHADWRDLAQGQRDHMLWKNTLRWSDGRVASVNARLSSVRGADGQVEQVAALLEVEA